MITTVSGSTIYYDVLRTGGGRARYTVTTANFPLNTAFNQQGVKEYSNTLPTITNLQLPDGSSYSFTYEPQFGELASVTLPTGGIIKYGWLTFFDSYQNANRWVASRTVGSDPATTFTPNTVTRCSASGTGCQEKMTVHRPSGDETVYNLTLNNGAWNTNTQRFTGSAVSGTLLSTTDTAYNFSNPCGSACTGSQFITASSATTTLPGVNLKLTDAYTYSDPYRGLIGSKKRYDFYSGSLPSNPIVETDYSYGSTVPGDVTQVNTIDGAGNLLTSDRMRYDTSPSYSTSPLAQHDLTKSLSTYLQSASHWVNTGGASQFLITDTKLDDAGTARSVSTPYYTGGSSGARTFGYDSTDTFPISVTEPAVPSGVALVMSLTPDPTTGLPTSASDYNSQPTTYKNYDSLGRVGEVDSADTGWTTVAYTPTGRTTTTKVDSSRNATTVEATDEFGRSSRIAVANGQGSNPWYQADTCYDSNGNVQTVSLPYAGTGFGMAKSCSGTSYTYDALGRPLTIANADGTVKYQYLGRATSVTDVNGVQTISQVDGLGRVTAVCEISSNNLVGASPQSCGLDLPGTGYLTLYAYNLSNHTTTISQGSQTRVFQTDSLGRTTYASEPERGITTYSYAYNGTGLLVSRKRPCANCAASSTAQTTTSTQYDFLGRVQTVSYSDTVTPSRNFYYDQNYSFGLQGTSNNVKGMLAGAVSRLNGDQTAFQYSYDVMSRIVSMWQCAPSTCAGQYARSVVSRGYDLAGNLTYQFVGASGGIAYGRSIAGEITSITNQSYTDKNNPPNLVSSVVNGPFGPTSWVLGNGLGVAVGYDALGRINQKFLCNGAPSLGCSTQFYGHSRGISGAQVKWMCDTANISAVPNLANCRYSSYDEFNRLTAFNGLSWSYDRWGNRTSNTGAATSYNPATNRNYNLTYDAAGNVMNDGMYGYAYDAEGNLLQAGQTSYVYDSANRRVRVGTSSTSWTEYLFDPSGQRASSWIPNGPGGGFGNEGRIWWDGQLLATRDWNGLTYFHHSDSIGTERQRTDPFGQIATTSRSDAFGNGFSQTSNDQTGPAQDNLEFAGLDHDTESGTDHAGYRQYASIQGRWMSPDPYDGSYNGNPQSLNRYSYTMNNPLMMTDPSGLFCGFGVGEAAAAAGQVHIEAAACLANGIYTLFHFLDRPRFHGSLKPRPGAGPVSDQDPWNETIGYPQGQFPSGGNPIQVLGGVLGFPTSAGCEFGACGFANGDSNATTAELRFSIDVAVTVAGWAYNAALLPGANGSTPRRYFGTYYCGPGGAGSRAGVVNGACAAHDQCFTDAGINADGNTDRSIYWSPDQVKHARICNQVLFNTLNRHIWAVGSEAIRLWLQYGDHFGILRQGTTARD